MRPASAFSRRSTSRAYVYVDGFNLYYGALRGTRYKWLDLRKLCELLLPRHQVDHIKYFTARVSARPADPDQPTRQQMYLRALGALRNVEIVYGHFLTTEVYLPLAGFPPEGPVKYVRVVRTEEKGSDVNLATHLLRDAFRKRFDVAVLVTNDSDLLEPVRVVRRELDLPVGLINPHRRASRVLVREASFVKRIRTGVLRASQLPRRMRDDHGPIVKPVTW